MSSRVNFSPLVFPACVPGPDYKFKNLETVTTTGWGYTRSQPYFLEPDVLQELELKIENRPWCERFIEKRCKDGRITWPCRNSGQDFTKGYNKTYIFCASRLRFH